MRGSHNHQRARFRPRVEALEDRTVPTAIQTGTALTVTGQTIVIIDTGSNSASNTTALTVTSDGVKQTFAGNITSIFINGTPGGDNVFYFLGGNTEQKASGTGPLFFTARASRTVTTNLDSSARDAFTLWFQQAQTLVGANYQFNVNGGSKGNNYLVHSDGLTIDNTSVLVLNLRGGSGNDKASVNLNNTIVGPSFNPGFTGESVPPAGMANTRGGFLYIGAFGIGGTDRLFVNLSLDNTSQGTVVGDVQGGSTNNTVGLVVNYPPTPPPTVAPTGFKPATTLLLLDGGRGTNNTGIHTVSPAVMTLDLQTELLVL
jgi:hypothetical protein